MSLQPGDVLFHNVLVLHGSPPGRSRPRRVVYIEFRPAETEKRFGPRSPAQIPLMQRQLLACRGDRARAAYATNEKPFVYRSSSQFPPPSFGPDDELRSYRYGHPP